MKKPAREVETTIRQEGERAVIEAGVNGVHPELVKLLGRLRYRTSYGPERTQPFFGVAFLSGIMASELGIDPTVARRAGPAARHRQSTGSTKWKARMWTSAWRKPASIRKAKP